jgi:ABC-type sulfate/molybdate transport systems ATPase subunit
MARIACWIASRSRIAQLLTMLRLEGLGERKVTALSGGQRRRVALGRALAINPQVVLLEEPLSNLDARVREEVRHEIKTLQRELGITTVYVTHDRQEAMVMADRIAIPDAGHVAQIGTPEEIYNCPNSPFVASFMGAANVVPLTVRRGERYLVIADGPYNRGVTIDASGFFTRGIDEISAQTKPRTAPSTWSVIDWPAEQPPVVVVVDTEAEFDWSRQQPRRAMGVTSVKLQMQVQRIFERYAVRPTYVLDYPVSTTREAYEIIHDLYRSGACEIGAHLQPWDTPRCRAENGRELLSRQPSAGARAREAGAAEPRYRRKPRSVAAHL